MSNGRAVNHQTGIHNDSAIEGLKKLVDTVHNEGSKIAFQLVHSGRQNS
jgi:2,4-dienoyl-CoA reductase (NADPH2)